MLNSVHIAEFIDLHERLAIIRDLLDKKRATQSVPQQPQVQPNITERDLDIDIWVTDVIPRTSQTSIRGANTPHTSHVNDSMNHNSILPYGTTILVIDHQTVNDMNESSNAMSRGERESTSDTHNTPLQINEVFVEYVNT